MATSAAAWNQWWSDTSLGNAAAANAAAGTPGRAWGMVDGKFQPLFEHDDHQEAPKSDLPDIPTGF